MHVVVVGGGIIGVTSAFMLQRSGFEVTVVDRARADDGVASNVNAGLITPGHSLGWASPAMLRRLPAVLGNRTPQLRLSCRFRGSCSVGEGGWVAAEGEHGEGDEGFG